NDLERGALIRLLPCLKAHTGIMHAVFPSGVGWCSPLTPRFSIGRTSRSARYRKIKFDTIDNDRYWQIVLRERGRGVCLCSQRAQPSTRPHAASGAAPPLDGDGATRAQRFAGLYPLLRIFQALRLLTRLVGIL